MNPLTEPLNNDIRNCLKELCFGRPAWVQLIINKCIQDVNFYTNVFKLEQGFNVDTINKVWSGHKYDEKKNNEGYNVIDKFICIICGHEWTPIYPDGTKQLECPSCDYMNQIEVL